MDNPDSSPLADAVNELNPLYPDNQAQQANRDGLAESAVLQTPTTTLESVENSVTIPGPRYQPGSDNNTSGSRSVPPPSRFKLYYASSDAKKGEFGGWMNTLCFPRPISDVDTFCLSCFLPYVQYGKTNWRLEQLREGKDSSDDSFKCSDALNRWCGIHCVLTIFHLGWIATGFQRNRVRATYGINGQAWEDFLISCLCNCCVLMQSDREVQAREGRDNCITNSGYNNIVHRRTTEYKWSIEPTPLPRNSEPPMRYPGHKYPGIDENTSPQKKGGTLKKPPPFPTNNAKLKHRDGKIGSPFRNSKSEPPHRKASDFSLLEFNIFQSSKDSANKAAEISSCGTAEAVIENVTPEQESSADLLAKTSGGENLKETTGHDEASKAQDKPDANENFQHLITRRDSNATIMRWKHNSVRIPRKSVSSSRGLAGCGFGPTSMSITNYGAKQAPRNSVKMSYIHDFTDCPINKAILDYYERQQQLVDGKEQEHGLEDCGQSTDPSTSTIASASGTRSPDHQHELDEYSPNGSGGGSQDPSSAQKARHYVGKLNPDEDADGEQVTMASERSGHLEKNNEGSNTKAGSRAQHHHNRHIGHHAGHFLDQCTIQGSSQDYTVTRRQEHTLSDCHKQTGSDKKESLLSRDLMYNENMPDPSSALKGGKNQDYIVEKQKGKVRIDDEACEIGAAAPKSDESSRDKLASYDHAFFQCPDELVSDGTQGGSKQANTDEIQNVKQTIYQCPNNDTVVDSIAYTAAMSNKSTGRKTFKTLQLSDGVINSHKDSQWDHDNQQVLVHALSKCFPTKFKEYDTGASDPLVTLEHALGENHAGSLPNKGSSGQPLEFQPENKKDHSVQLPESTSENKENDSR